MISRKVENNIKVSGSEVSGSDCKRSGTICTQHQCRMIRKITRHTKWSKNARTGLFYNKPVVKVSWRCVTTSSILTGPAALSNNNNNRNVPSSGGIRGRQNIIFNSGINLHGKRNRD